MAEPNVAVVIPAFNVERHLGALLPRLPDCVGWIVVVNDCSTDGTGELITKLEARDPRVIGISHTVNAGVGGAMATGFAAALKTPAEIIVKLDGDGQMAPEAIPGLIRPLLEHRADYAKGNRFRHLAAIRRMPLVRRLGNLGLSFAVKLGSGYWRSFDPTNGFVAIRREVLAAVNLDALDRRYFFEISLLHQLSLIGAVVKDVAMPAIYGNETSHLRVKRVLFEFPVKLLVMTARRWIYRKLAFDFTMDGLYLLMGAPMLLFSFVFGVYNWHAYGAAGVPTPTGTIMIAALTLVVGIQFLTSAISLDILAEPTEPIFGSWPEAALPETVQDQSHGHAA